MSSAAVVIGALRVNVALPSVECTESNPVTATTCLFSELKTTLCFMLYFTHINS